MQWIIWYEQYIFASNIFCQEWAKLLSGITRANNLSLTKRQKQTNSICGTKSIHSKLANQTNFLCADIAINISLQSTSSNILTAFMQGLPSTTSMDSRHLTPLVIENASDRGDASGLVKVRTAELWFQSILSNSPQCLVLLLLFFLQGNLWESETDVVEHSVKYNFPHDIFHQGKQMW